MQIGGRRDSIDARYPDGIVRTISRHAYRAELLPAAVKAWRAEPDRLAEAILTAVEAGFAEDVVAAAEHLGKIDADRRRRSWIPALVFCRTGKFKRAEDLIVRARELFGDCADFRYVDAEILFGRHLRSKGDAEMRNALAADANHSRALRLLTGHVGDTIGADANRDELAEIAGRAGAWRARLLLSDSRLSEGNVVEGRRLAVEAAGCEPWDAIVAPLSALLARWNETALMLELVLPRYEPSRHDARCGINLLFALLESGRREEGTALLEALGASHPGAFEKHRAFHASAFAAIEPDSANAPGASVALHRALAAYARQESPSTRRKMVEKLIASVLLLPLCRPVVDVPILDLGLPEPVEPAIEAVTAIDSMGESVTLAFTSEKSLVSWDARHRHRIALDAMEVLQLVSSIGGGAIVIDAAGPASLELSKGQVTAILERSEPPERGEHAPFIVEPLRGELPARLVDEAANFVRAAEGVREGFLFQLVSERSGASPGFAIVFEESADERSRRDTILDAQDRLVWESGKKRRRLQVVPVSEGRLADYLRLCAVRVE